MLKLSKSLLERHDSFYQIIKRQASPIDERIPHGLIVRTPVGQKVVRGTNYDSVRVIAVIVHIFQAVIFPSVLNNRLIQGLVCKC